ncbi:MAG: Gfo/Idh/MocA family oxidoreductase [Chloroflexi bacterium]|nr:Gfo/Idh/MocA family oxidoreductase [Chloroflexota bacterium]MYK60424.1 Gfo/Idh/MocA family oxidoreductase [Chloroflexota bacterium]
MTLKVAVVGLGGIGTRHAGIYDADDRCEIVAVCDAIAEKADAAAKRYGCKAFTSVNEMIQLQQIDIASVCTAGLENGGDHYEPTMALLSAGIPVLGEKPISNRISEAREMVAFAKEKNLRYGINLNHRFTPAAVRAKEWVDGGRLGELNIVNMTMWINNPNESSPYFHMRALHPHSIDVMQYFCGDVKRVQGFFKRGKGRKIWSNVQVNMQFENGVIGHLTGSYDAGGSYGLERLEVVGSEARFVILEACEQLEFYPRRSQQVERFSYLGGMMSFGETFESRITRWVGQNIEGADPADIDGSGEDALKSQLIIEAAIESWENGTVVDVEGN